jgi:hypothetical protein
MEPRIYFFKKNYIKKLANFFSKNLAKMVEFTHNKTRTKKIPHFLKGEKKTTKFDQKTHWIRHWH